MLELINEILRAIICRSVAHVLPFENSHPTPFLASLFCINLVPELMLNPITFSPSPSSNCHCRIGPPNMNSFSVVVDKQRSNSKSTSNTSLHPHRHQISVAISTTAQHQRLGNTQLPSIQMDFLEFSGMMGAYKS